MPRHRNELDYAKILASTGEVTVGAYARRQRSRNAVAIGFGAALLALGCYLIWALALGEALHKRHAALVKVQCIRCATTTSARLAPGAADQFMCPACHERSGRSLWACQECAHEFVPGGGARVVACPKCRGQRVGVVLAR